MTNENTMTTASAATMSEGVERALERVNELMADWNRRSMGGTEIAVGDTRREHERQSAAVQDAATVINEQLMKLVRGPEKVEAADFGITADVLEQLVENARATKYLRENFRGSKLGVAVESRLTIDGIPMPNEA